MEMQKLIATAICTNEGLPTMVIIGDEDKARDYLEKETSFPIEQFKFIQVNVVI